MSKNDEKKVIKEKSKVGHRRVTDEGTVTYKRKTTSDIQQALQMGIRITVQSAHDKAKRDMLLKDFGVVDTLSFPRAGSKETPAHSLGDFKFKTFAPIAFRYFRDFFEVDIGDYLNSICHQELRELSNAGASGSIFYITCDDEFIIKTVEHKEASFLQKLLPEYYINLMQHPRTLLPKFYGLYCYQTMGKNIRFVIMNNLLPSIKIHEKYDLKGSTYKRIASLTEKSKSSPTLKDLDFRDSHPEGLFLEVETYEALLNTIQRDCRVLESFRIMDYSLLLGIHNLDTGTQTRRRKSDPSDKLRVHSVPLATTTDISAFGEDGDPHENDGGLRSLEDTNKIDSGGTKILHPDQITTEGSSTNTEYFTPSPTDVGAINQSNSGPQAEPPLTSVYAVAKRHLDRHSSSNKSTRRIAAFSTVLESIQVPVETFDLQNSDRENIPAGGIPARNKVGDRLILFMGIIDILQSYRFSKRLEHNVKAIFLDAETISVTNPSFYCLRFQEFFGNLVFKKIPSLDQPQILGNHARRFRNFVHLAMRQQPDRKPSLVKDSVNKSADYSKGENQSNTETTLDDSDEVQLTFDVVPDDNNRVKSRVSFTDASD